MKNLKNFKILFILAVFLFFGGIIKANATDFVALYDSVLQSNTFTIYTDKTINDDNSFQELLSNSINSYVYWEYWNSNEDNSYYYLSYSDCQYSTMKCNKFFVYRNYGQQSEEIKTYDNVSINIVSDLSTYFPMVDGNNNVVINYDESFFTSDEQKNNYIQTYISNFGSGDNNGSISYYYDKNTNTIVRNDSVPGNNYYTYNTNVYNKTINEVTFNYVDGEYSDSYSRLTNNGNITINTDATVTQNLLANYLYNFNANNMYFSIDGSIKDNKAFIKLCSYQTGKCEENHLVTINRNADIAAYFSMVNNENNVVIDYAEEMFSSEDEKNIYISNYFSSFYTYLNNSSTSYSYDSNTKILTRTESYNSNAVGAYYKTINNIVFGFEETAYSDDFKQLTTTGSISIKTDSNITVEMVRDYLNYIPTIANKYFRVDGQISNNKVFIELCSYVTNGPSQCDEKHIITLVQNNNIDSNKFNNIGMGSYYDIKTDEPQNRYNFFINNNYQNRNINIENNDGTTDYIYVTFEYDAYTHANIRYVVFDEDGSALDIQFHRVPIRFVGYDNNVSETYEQLVGDSITINADSLDLQTINNNIDYNLHAFNCNDDFSMCDVEYYDYQTYTSEIHRVSIVLNDEMSDTFVSAFDIKDDGSIDILKDQDLEIDFGGYYWIYYSFYDEVTGNSLSINNCYNEKCTLSLRNYRSGLIESHNVDYNFVNSGRTDFYASKIYDSIDIYPGDKYNYWQELRNNSKLFNINYNYSSQNGNVVGCDSNSKECSVMLFNSDKKLEIHNTSVTVKEGKSPEFEEFFPGDTLALNSIYLDSNYGMFLDDASMGYLVSKTKTWSYLSNYSNGTADIVYDGFETHTMNIEFEEIDQSIKEIVDAAISRINAEVGTIIVDDLEYINDFYYSDDNGSAISIFNSSALYDKLSSIIDNKHISYFFVPRCGDSGPFGTYDMGGVVLYYDGIAYGRTGELEKTENHILYIPDNTEDTKEAYIAAAQARIDEYLGDDSGLVVSYAREVEGNEVNYNVLGIDPNNFDGHVYKLNHEDKEQLMLIVKDSSKMKTSTFNASDPSSNVTITSDDANYPTNTIVSFENVDTSLQQYQQLLTQLGLTTAQIINVDLYSPTIGNINQFNNVTFNVSFPINIVNYQNKTLYAYFIGPNGVEEHPITVDDFLGTYSTTHFSTYIISEKVESSSVTNVAITSNKDSVNFGELEKGFSDNSVQKVTITNTGDVPVTLAVTNIPTGDGPFAVYAVDGSQEIAPNGTMEISLIAKSSSPFSSIAGDYSGVYEITATEVGGTRTAKVSVTANVKVVEPQEDPVVPVSNTSISYTTHVQDIGWQEYVSNGEMAGTEGQAKRLEGIKIKLIDAPYAGDIEYRTHIQNIGWESEFKKNDGMSGTSGQALRLEAIEIKLNGEMDNHYDIYYRVHAQNFGWLGWARNGEQSGTAGYAYRLEGIEIKLVTKGTKFEGYGDKETFVDATTGKVMPIKDDAKIAYTTHVENIGWQPYVTDGKMAGTSGQSLRLEGIKIKLVNQEYTGDIEYRTHIQNIGWESEFKKNDEMSGTSGRALRLEAIEIKLTGEMEEHYDIYYRVHAQNFGWLGWAKNGEQAGTAGFAYRLEGIEIKLVPKGETPSFINSLKPFYNN